MNHDTSQHAGPVNPADGITTLLGVLGESGDPRDPETLRYALMSLAWEVRLLRKAIERRPAA